jgi:shikimate 5-dehydrogenase
VDGLGMLVHQAAAQLLLWTGEEAPVEAMWQAAESVDRPA